MITASLDVTKFDKTKFKHVTKRNGEKAVYADIVLIETPNSEYGDYLVVQGTTKEERDAGKKGAILGNAKVFKSRKQDAKQQAQEAQSDLPPEDVPL